MTACLLLAALCAGCVARKVVTVPAKAATKTAIKTTGKAATGTVKAITPLP